ncbi:MAG: hypothetical protein TE42_01030 [Candidatus Synechococcus spongiarum SP3]|uniref:Uncharacterized protein n=1 Tax=Candidatus Synechococcus spongiarum SP3 TaxID=1604020 RepID=A0A0G2IX14_9SYNE|nr:MAG: hypothetical protein TE42_01030 [Candidatus Synechococcus spongiarum SP3]
MRDDLKASETRQREDMRKLRSDVKELGSRLDRLVESLLASLRTVVGRMSACLIRSGEMAAAESRLLHFCAV